jgi:ComF family protein
MMKIDAYSQARAQRPNSFWSRLLDMIAPRTCVVCGKRLSIEEECICTVCNFRLPRTNFAQDAYENEMAKLFWGRIPIERCTALMYYHSHAQSANIVYDLKYHNKPEVGNMIGRMMAQEFLQEQFFDDIDIIIPLPLAPERERYRGYNQSFMLAQGINEVTGLPIVSDVVIRKKFIDSQTEKDRWTRLENVEGVFELVCGEKIQGKHILLVDDVVTTGATICSCGEELGKAGNIKISVISIGFVKGQ